MFSLKYIRFLSFLLFIFVLSNCQKDENTDPVIPIPTPPDSIFNIQKVPEIQLEFTVEEWNKLLSYYDQNPKNEKKVVAKYTFTVDNQTITLDSIGLKLRGNTSRRRPEGNIGQMHQSVNPDWHHCHFGLDFDKFKENQKFKGISKINLKWFKDDANYVREIYSYDLFKRFGVWTAPRASYCRLTIKVQGDATPAYYGVYAMLESVDEDFIKYRNSKWSENGFMWKGGWAGSYNADFVQTTSIGVEDVKLNPANSLYYAYDLKTREAELENGKAELINFIQDLNSKSGEEFKTWIETRMDVNLFLKTYATNVMLGMWDDYWINGNNFYFYMSPDYQVYFIPYDYDNTLGTSYLISNSGTQNPLTWGPQSGRPLINKILSIPEYQTLYKNFILELSQSQSDLFDPDKSLSRIIQWQSMIGGYISNDTGEDMSILDQPASWGNCSFYRLQSGNDAGGASGNANYFSSRIASIPF